MIRKVAAGIMAAIVTVGLTFAIQAPAQANITSLPACGGSPPSAAQWNAISWTTASYGRGKICLAYTSYMEDGFYANIDDTLTDGKCVGGRISYIGYSPWLYLATSCGPETVSFFTTEPGACRVDGPWGLTRAMIFRWNTAQTFPEVSNDMYNDPDGGC